MLLNQANKIIDALIKDKAQRIVYAKNSLAYFTFIYLSHYIKNEPADFHWQIYNDLQNNSSSLIEIIAFRGSAKSTIASLAYPLWCALFKKKNFIIPCSDTHTQAKQVISNIIYELENNQKILSDFGSFKSEEEWQATNIFLKNKVRILSRSRGQKIRGLRHLQSRPDLIILDDVENIEDVRTKEQRDKTEEWFLSDVLPALDTTIGLLVVTGNLLHQDSLISRIKNRIIENKNGLLREYPLLDENKNSIWKEEYPPEKIEELKKNRYFQREYLLIPTLTEGQLVKGVFYYNALPELQRIAIGVDLAISKTQAADYTSINILGEAKDGKMYNIKNIYGKWNFNEALEQIWNVYQSNSQFYSDLPIYLGIEDVAYQKSAIEEFYRRYKIQPTPVKQTKDKKARVETLLPYLENEQLLFKRDGMEDLINQLLNFGVERYDDCVDAFEISVRLIINAEKPAIQWL